MSDVSKMVRHLRLEHENAGADLLESQATRIATLSEALRLIAAFSATSGDGVYMKELARRALGQGEAK